MPATNRGVQPRDVMPADRRALTVLCILAALGMGLIFGNATPLVHGVRDITLRVVLPEAALASWAGRATGGIGERFRDMAAAFDENVGLRSAAARLEGEVHDLSLLVEENRRLRALLQMRADDPKVVAVALVAARDPGRWFGSVLLDKGRRHGVRRGLIGVVVQQGARALVGRVVEVWENGSKLLLVSDPLFAAVASLPRTGDDGVVEGSGGPWLTMRYLSPDVEVTAGEQVVTSTRSGVFPPNLLIGRIERRTEERVQGYAAARVRPAANLNRLYQILLLTPAGGSKVSG